LTPTTLQKVDTGQPLARKIKRIEENGEADFPLRHF
jgi:hypothetical protein